VYQVIEIILYEKSRGRALWLLDVRSKTQCLFQAPCRTLVTLHTAVTIAFPSLVLDRFSEEMVEMLQLRCRCIPSLMFSRVCSKKFFRETNESNSAVCGHL